MLNLETLRDYVTKLEREWGTRPIVVLACSGGSDEHWQIWHPDDVKAGFQGEERMPHLVLCPEGTVSTHPDTKR